jgi:trans-aconitate methyltransferase
MKWQKFQNKSANRAFLSSHPSFPLPPDELLFETGQINYPWYLKSGQEAANEFAALFQQLHPSPARAVMDWGCGVGRVTRHLPHYFPEAGIFGIDINAASIQWLEQHIPAISFLPATEIPQLLQSSFDLIIGTSVLTHIPADQQASVLLQLQQWLAPQGIACISTRGTYYHPQLSSHQLRQLEYNGLLTCGGTVPGSRSMKTYHTTKGMLQLLPADMEIMLYYDGTKFPGVLGGQDLWIIKKTAHQENPTAQ